MLIGFLCTCITAKAILACFYKMLSIKLNLFWTRNTVDKWMVRQERIKWVNEQVGAGDTCLKQRKNVNPQSACQTKPPVFSAPSLPLSFQHPFYSAETKTQSQLALKDSCIHIRPLINHANTFDMHMSTQSDALLTINLKTIHWLSCNSIHCADLYRCFSWELFFSLSFLLVLAWI